VLDLPSGVGRVAPRSRTATGYGLWTFLCGKGLIKTLFAGFLPATLYLVACSV
jgi:hypothetical protein